MSFLTQSHQVFFGHPLCLIPSTSHVIQRLTQSLSSFHSTCPNHLNLLFLIIIWTAMYIMEGMYFKSGIILNIPTCSTLDVNHQGRIYGGPGPQASLQQRASHQTRHILGLFVIHASCLQNWLTHSSQKTEDILILIHKCCHQGHSFWLKYAPNCLAAGAFP